MALDLANGDTGTCSGGSDTTPSRAGTGNGEPFLPAAGKCPCGSDERPDPVFDCLGRWRAHTGG
jgi:hypothetical protein